MKWNMLTFFEAITEEMVRARLKHGPCNWSKHEFYGVLLEEVDELWETIKKDEPPQRLLEELIQVAAVCAEYYPLVQKDADSSFKFINCIIDSNSSGIKVDP